MKKQVLHKKIRQIDRIEKKIYQKKFKIPLKVKTIVEMSALPPSEDFKL